MIHKSNTLSTGNLLLTELEEVMRAAGLWSLVHPPAEAMASQQPFACDTLAFEQWLQFIFIPRLQALFGSDSLAPPMQIHPMAEVTWQGDHKPVQSVLARFDSWSRSLHE